MTFCIPKKCNIESVNQALLEAGYTDVDIFYDVYNSNYVSVSYTCYDEHGHPYNTTQRTRHKTARAWAEAFDEGRFQLLD